MHYALLAATAAAIAAAAAAAQVPSINRGKMVSPSALTIADLDKRFPSTLPQQLRARVRTPASQWQVNPANLQLAPIVVANNIAANINQRFAGKSVGYSVTVMMPNGAVAEANGGAARRAPDGAARAWTGNDRITIASVSKMFTAAAIVKAAAARGVSLSTPAWNLLPASWTYSAGFKTITVAELLSHNSGIRGCNISLASLQACAATPINPADKNPAIPIWTKYNNANHAYLRLILTRIYDGALPATAEQQGQRYAILVNMLVNGPAGVGGSTCAPPAVNPALSYISTTDDGIWNSTALQNYNFTNVKPGTPWGDMTAVCGSQGWNMSSRQLATFANGLFVTNKVLPAPTVQTMRQNGYGMMYFDFGGGLSAYGHGGYHPAPGNDGEVNTLSLAFNNGVSIGMVINSRFNGDFGQHIAEAIRANM